MKSIEELWNELWEADFSYEAFSAAIRKRDAEIELQLLENLTAERHQAIIDLLGYEPKDPK